MANPVGSTTVEIPEPACLSIKELCQRLAEGKNVFSAIAEYPQIGIYLRFADFYALCLSYLENDLDRQHKTVKSLLKELSERQCNSGSDNDGRSSLHKTMMTSVELLTRYAQLYRDHRDIAKAPKPPSFFLKGYYDLINSGNDSRTPNGIEASRYDPDTASPADIMTLDKPNVSPFENLMAYSLTQPFCFYILDPIKGCFNHIARRNKITDNNDPVKAKYILMLSRQLSLTFVTLVLSVAITTLKAYAGTKAAVPVMTGFALAFAYSAQFLGQESMQMNILVTTFFQTMVFFVSSNN